jgi:hypothetical protein
MGGLQMSYDLRSNATAMTNMLYYREGAAAKDIERKDSAFVLQTCARFLQDAYVEGVKHPVRAGEGHGSKMLQLVKSLHELHARFGEPEQFSFLDGGIHLSWSASAAGLAGYEGVPVDTELLHYSSWSPWRGCKIHIYIYRDELTGHSSRDQVWSGVNDMAETREESG